MAPSAFIHSISDAIRQLQAWEAQLKPWFTGIRLLGEIALSIAEVEALGQALRTAGKRRICKPTWPHTLAVYMTAIAAHNEERSYWAVLTANLGMDDTPHIHEQLSKIFTEQIKHYKLPNFRDVGGYRRVTPIRLHGGIPAYSLPDFFEEVVLPAARRDEYAGLCATELIRLSLERPAVQHFVDSPVRYFLEYGGAVAADFVKRCVQMACYWESHAALPPTQEVPLPRYVMDAFASFMDAHKQTGQGHRLRPPRLFLSPSTGDALFTLELPEEPVEVEQAGWRYCWRIQPLHPLTGAPLCNEATIKEGVRVRRNGNDLITIGSRLPLFLPPCQLDIYFEAVPPDSAQRQLGRWRLTLGPGVNHSLLAFRPADSRLVPSNQALPAESLWLLYPRYAKLEVGGVAHCVLAYPELMGAWADWQIVEWDLRQARSLWLVDESGTLITLPISVQQRPTEAQLIGDNRLSRLADPDDLPFFVGTPPSLWLPRLTGYAATEEMKQWQITLTPHWATISQLPHETAYSLSDWQAKVAVDNEGFTLSLTHLLGIEVLGLFSLQIRGPRNFRQDLRLRLWSTLSIEDLAPYYLPGPHGTEPVHCSIVVAVGQQVLSPIGETATIVTAMQEPGRFQITIAAEAGEANLELLAPRPGQDPVRLLLRLAVPRLRWLLPLDDIQPKWCTTPDSLPAARFQQSHNRRLLLDWAGVDVLPDCSIVLLDATHDSAEILQESMLKPLAGNNQRHTLELSNFHDTIQYHEDVPILTLALQVRQSATRSLVPLLYLKRTLDLQTVVLDWDGQGRTWLHWDAPHRLRNRRVRIWSAWRPWEPAREYPIPDDALASPVADGTGSGMFSLPEVLPRGWYWLALCTAHLWETQCAPPLPTDDALISRDDDWMLRALTLHEMEEISNSQVFAVRFELACIYHAVGKYAERDEMVSWLCRYPDRGEPKQIVTLWHWLSVHDINSAKALCMRMYQPELLQRLFVEERDEEVRSAYLQGFTAMRSIKPEAVQLLLAYTLQPELIIHGLKMLLQCNPAKAVEYLLAQMEKGAFSEQDAFELLIKQVEISFGLLKKSSQTSWRDRLLVRLAERVANAGIVQPGDWVHCEAGWGRIERIMCSGNKKDVCFIDDPSLLLTVTLRHGEISERIEIDLEHKTIHFFTNKSVYRCNKKGCTGFSSADVRLLTEEHNRAAHMGIGPSFASIPKCSTYRQPLRFSRQRPKDLFV